MNHEQKEGCTCFRTFSKQEHNSQIKIKFSKKIKIKSLDFGRYACKCITKNIKVQQYKYISINFKLVFTKQHAKSHSFKPTSKNTPKLFLLDSFEITAYLSNHSPANLLPVSYSAPIWMLILFVLFEDMKCAQSSVLYGYLQTH